MYIGGGPRQVIDEGGGAAIIADARRAILILGAPRATRGRMYSWGRRREATYNAGHFS